MGRLAAVKPQPLRSAKTRRLYNPAKGVGATGWIAQNGTLAVEADALRITGVAEPQWSGPSVDFTPWDQLFVEYGLATDPSGQSTLSDGRVIVTGGSTGSATIANVDVYDPARIVPVPGHAALVAHLNTRRSR